MATKIGILQQQTRAPGPAGRVSVQQPGGPRDVTSSFSRPVIKESSAGLEIDQQALDRFSNVFVRQYVSDQSEIQRKIDEQRAFDDKLAGLRDGAAVTGRNGEGYVERLEPPREQSVDYQQAWLAAATNNMLAGVQLDVSNSFNEIQNANIDWRSKQPKMMAILEARLAMMPPEIQTPMRDFGLSQIMSRQASIANEAQTREENLAVDGIKSRAEAAQLNAYNDAIAGRDPSIHVEALKQTMTEMVGLGRISQETADSTIAANTDQIIAVTAQARMSDHVFKGNVDPADLERFAVQLEEGGDFTIDILTGMDSRSGQPITQKMSAAKLRDDIKDPKLRSEIAASMRKSANLKGQYDAAYTKGNEFKDAFNALGPMDVLPADKVDDYNKMMERLVGAGALDTPEGQAELVMRMAKTKRIPPVIVDTLRNQIRSGDGAVVQKALTTWNGLATLEIDGMQVGQMMLDSLSEKDRKFFDERADVAAMIGAAGEDDKARQDLLMKVNTALEQNEMNVDKAVAIFNQGAKDDARFYPRLNAAWAEKMGTDTPAPPQVQEQFETAFRASLIIGTDRETAFENASARIFGGYEASPVFVSGYARTGDNSLVNPEGFVPASPKVNLRDETVRYAGDPKHEWLATYTQKALADSVLANDLMLPEGELEALGEMLKDPNALGNTIRIEPTTGDRNAPAYRVIVEFDEGPQVLRRANNAPLLIDPGMRRAQEQGRFELNKNKEILAGAAKDGLTRLETEFLMKNAPQFRGPRGLADTQISQAEFEKQMADSPIIEQIEYGIERSKIINGFKISMERLTQAAPVEVRGEKVTIETLKQAKTYGYDVALAAVKEIELLLPDGTGGDFMLNTALVESNFGKADGSFRDSGDIGIWQINAGSNGAYVEIKRRIALGDNVVARGAAVLEKGLGIDIANATKEDLKKPLVSAAYARLYYLTISRGIPNGVAEQGKIWKEHYNTHLGAGSEDGFISKVEKHRAVRKQLMENPLE